MPTHAYVMLTDFTYLSPSVISMINPTSISLLNNSFPLSFGVFLHHCFYVVWGLVSYYSYKLHQEVNQAICSHTWRKTTPRMPQCSGQRDRKCFNRGLPVLLFDLVVSVMAVMHSPAVTVTAGSRRECVWMTWAVKTPLLEGAYHLGLWLLIIPL